MGYVGVESWLVNKPVLWLHLKALAATSWILGKERERDIIVIFIFQA